MIKGSMRAQASAEFFVILAGISILLLLFVFIYSGQAVNLLQIKDILSAKKTAYQISSAINNIYLAGNGAEYNIVILQDNENITISNNNVLVEKNKIKVSAPLLTDKINATSISSGYRKIKNNNGLIEIG